MKNTFAFIALIAAIFSFNSCQKNGNTNIREIGYGTSFGMCVGYCVNDIAVSVNEVKFSKRKHETNSDIKTCTKKMTEEELNELKKLVNQHDFEKLPEVIGCPDCADGGAEWVALKIDGKIKKVTFEYGNAPSTLKKLVAKLKEIKESFKDCN